MTEEEESKKTPRTLEERLRQLLDWSINPEIKIAKNKYLKGEMIKIYEGGCIEYILSKPYRKQFNVSTQSSDSDTAMYKVVLREVSQKRAEEVMNDRHIIQEVEMHILYHPQQRIVYMFEYPSRHFLKKINPYYPEEYKDDTDKFLEEIGIPDNISRERRKTTRSRKKTDQ
ncbi:hypothetical protein KY312_01105 [Candidatus Woesearchaeota archaeon]|nr:hypothetical protein [Candidatus Woesearchaeota archaeon]